MQRLCCLMSRRLDYHLNFKHRFFIQLKEDKNGVPILLVEQNAKQALEIADKGYVLVDGANKVEGWFQMINDEKLGQNVFVENVKQMKMWETFGFEFVNFYLIPDHLADHKAGCNWITKNLAF